MDIKNLQQNFDLFKATVLGLDNSKASLASILNNIQTQLENTDLIEPIDVQVIQPIVEQINELLIENNLNYEINFDANIPNPWGLRTEFCTTDYFYKNLTNFENFLVIWQFTESLWTEPYNPIDVSNRFKNMTSKIKTSDEDLKMLQDLQNKYNIILIE